MRKFVFLLALFSFSANASTIIGSPIVEINPEGLYLIQIKISSTDNLEEDEILITNFKSDDEFSDFTFEYRIFENLEDYKRLTLAIPKNYLKDYISFRLNIKTALKKDIFIFLPQNDLAPSPKSQVSFKLPAKKIYGEPQRYDIARILSEEPNYEDNSGVNETKTFSLEKPINDKNEVPERPQSIPSNEVETIWSVSQSVSQNYDASIYQIMWGFYLENPNAFIDEDINMVRGDVDLNLPSPELVASTSNIRAKESIAFMNLKRNNVQEPVIKPILKLTAPVEIFNDSSGENKVTDNSSHQSNLNLIKEIDNSKLSASEIVVKNTSIIELESETDFSSKAKSSNNSKSFGFQDLFWVGVLSLLLGFVIAYMLIRFSKRPIFTIAAAQEDLLDENNTFQTNLSISNDIETQELDLVRTYIEMEDWEGATKILNKLIANSSNDLIVSEARLLLKEKK
jgi:FimV-like protein